MLFTVWIHLYTTRLVLQYLGVSDYGVYGVVGSVVSIFTTLNGGLIKAIQRFITYELGKTNSRLNDVFNTLLNATFIFAVLLFIILEIIGLWYLNNYINIPESSSDAAFWVYQFSVFTVLLSLISNPYDALVVAHEKMSAFAFISIIQSIMGLIAAYGLKYIPHNRLIYYALFLMLISLIIRLIYQIYSRMHFEESKYKLYIDTKLLKEVAKFAGWTSISSMLDTLTWQGVVLIINTFFGVAINAVYQLSTQVRNTLLSFALNVQRAIDPQITKSIASQNEERHNMLVYTGSKYGLYMNFFILIPCLNKTEYLLELWLGDIPKYAVEYCQIGMLMSIMVSGFELVRTSVLASGHIRDFMVIPSFIHLISLLIVIGVAYYSHNPNWTMMSIAILYALVYLIKLIYAKRTTSLTLLEFVIKVIYPCIIIGVVSFLVSNYIGHYIDDNIIGFIILGILTSFILMSMILLFGLDKRERLLCSTLVCKICHLKKKIRTCRGSNLLS